MTEIHIRRSRVDVGKRNKHGGGGIHLVCTDAAGYNTQYVNINRFATHIVFCGKSI